MSIDKRKKFTKEQRIEFWSNFHRERNTRLRITKYLKPPWHAYPEYESGSLGWRMGEGEDYMWDWQDWIRSLNQDELSRYQKKYPEPNEWTDFYQRIIKHMKHIPRDKGKDLYWDSLLEYYLKSVQAE